MLIFSGSLSQFFYPDLVASCLSLLLSGTRLNPICACRLRDRRHGLCRNSRPLTVHLADFLTIRRKHRHQRVYSLLADGYSQVLTGGHGDLVEMRLTAGEFSVEGLTGFQRNSLLSAWLRAAVTSGGL